MAEEGWQMGRLLCLQTSLILLSVTFPGADSISAVVLDATVYSTASVGQYNNYGSVRLFKFDIPLGTTYASWSLLANQSHPNCAQKDIVMSLQQGGYPLVNPLNETFPPGFYLHRTYLQQLLMKSNGSHRIYDIVSPLSGTWYGAAYSLEDVSSVIKSLARGKCSYTLAVNLTSMGYENIPELLVDARQSPQRLRMGPNQKVSYLRFRLDKHTWWYEVNITRCVRDHVPMDTCPVNLYGRSQALPGDRFNSFFVNCSAVDKGAVCRLEGSHPKANTFQYLRIVKVGNQNITFDISVGTRECGNVSGSFFAQEIESNQVSKVRKRSAGQEDIIVEPTIHTRFDNVCVSFMKLYRTTEVRNNFITTYAIKASQQEFVENIAPIPSLFARIFQFDVRPAQDTGGTLRFSIEFNDTELVVKRSVLTNMSVCIQRGEIPVKGSAVRCHPRDFLQLSSASINTYTTTRYFPYPEEGTWYISMQQVCYIPNATTGEEVLKDCPGFMLPVKFELRSTACVDQNCGQYGSCREFFGASFAFSACQCRADVMGYQCQDWSHAHSRQTQLLYTLLLTTSNLFFIPAVIMAVVRKRYPEAFIYFANMFFSSFYHACDMGPWSVYILCIMPYHVLSYCDFFCSIMSFWVTLIAVSEIKQPLYSLAHMVGVVALAMGVEWKQFGIITYAVPVGIGLLIVLTNYGVRSFQRKKWYPGKRRCLLLVPGMLLAVVGICFYSFIESDDNYPYTHSAWHACMALSIIFFLPARKTNPNSSETSSESDEYNNSILEFHQETDDNDMVSLVAANHVDFGSVQG